ncbi:MAG: hypothetical protein QCH99_09140 [Candidatus Bathyarchaeota archaeon]|nr:hypothetical protein [Candidatus Bathyarchaeum tardum]
MGDKLIVILGKKINFELKKIIPNHDETATYKQISAEQVTNA